MATLADVRALLHDLEALEAAEGRRVSVEWLAFQLRLDEILEHYRADVMAPPEVVAGGPGS